jgi:tetratricopeptide (TPR) repeat protein
MIRVFQCFNPRKKDSHDTSDSLGKRSKGRTTIKKRFSRSQQVTQSLKCDTSETEECSVIVQRVAASVVGNLAEATTMSTPDLLDRTQVLSPSPDVRAEAFSDDEDDDDNTPAIGIARRQLFVSATDSKPPDPMIQFALQAAEKVLEPSTDITFECDPSKSEVDDGVETKPHSRNHSRTLDRSGNDLYEQGDMDQAFVKYEEALQWKRQALWEFYNHSEPNEEERARALASIATSINNVAFLRHSRGFSSPEATLELYEMSLRIKQDILGPDHLSVGKTLNNIGSIYFFQKNFQQAAVTYEQAREILRLRLGHDHLDVCTVTANLGDVRCSMKQWDRAVQEYRDALDLRWKLLGPSDAKVVRLMEQIAELEMFMNQENALNDVTIKRHERLYGPIIKDVRKLQKELQRDMDDLNMLESQIPIEMNKEKETVFREMREISFGHDVDNADAWNSDTLGKICDIPPMECVEIDDEFDSTKLEDCMSVSSSDFPSSREFSYYKSPLNLSDDERKQALASVKERLAAMKAKRESLSPIESTIKSVAVENVTLNSFSIQ